MQYLKFLAGHVANLLFHKAVSSELEPHKDHPLRALDLCVVHCSDAAQIYSTAMYLHLQQVSDLKAFHAFKGRPTIPTGM